MAARGLKEVPPPGTRVQLTGYFLKSTGQQRGSEGSKKWTVVPCDCGLCSRGDFVAVDEPTPEEELRTTYADIPKADRAKHGILWRHINKGNLQIVGKVPHSRDLSDAPELVAGKKAWHHATKKSSAAKKSPAQLQREIDEVLAKPGASLFPQHIAIVTYQGRRFGGSGGFKVWFHTTSSGPASYTTAATRAKAFEIADAWNAKYGKTTPRLQPQDERDLQDDRHG